MEALDFFKAVFALLTTHNWVVILKYEEKSEDGLFFYDVIVCARRRRSKIEVKKLVDMFEEVSAN